VAYKQKDKAPSFDGALLFRVKGQEKPPYLPQANIEGRRRRSENEGKDKRRRTSGFRLPLPAPEKPTSFDLSVFQLSAPFGA
ncbi:MAG: hypothetical protein IJB26_05350, partial [Clostridia bacterium]|nr:hypothetical protein [Clostridia bacterium]